MVKKCPNYPRSPLQVGESTEPKNVRRSADVEKPAVAGKELRGRSTIQVDASTKTKKVRRAADEETQTGGAKKPTCETKGYK